MTAQTGPGDEASMNTADRPVGRVRFMDAQRVNLDGFAAPDASLGLVAMDAPADPVPTGAEARGRPAWPGRSQFPISVVTPSRNGTA